MRVLTSLGQTLGRAVAESDRSEHLRISNDRAAPTHLAVLVGPPVRVSCRAEGLSQLGVTVAGDVYIVPAGMSTVWEIEGAITALLVRVPQALLEKVASETERDGSATEIVPRLLTRDPQIEHIAWALKAEFEGGDTNGGLFLDSLGTALALHLLARHSSRSLAPDPVKGGMPVPRLRKLLAYIEDNLDGPLTLASLAEVVDLSSSHLRALFRQSMGLSVHQYVVRRRVERARTLLESGKHSSTEVALASGFAHQSHLARQMRRILGVTPTEVRRLREAPHA